MYTVYEPKILRPISPIPPPSWWSWWHLNLWTWLWHAHKLWVAYLGNAQPEFPKQKLVATVPLLSSGTTQQNLASISLTSCMGFFLGLLSSNLEHPTPSVLSLAHNDSSTLGPDMATALHWSQTYCLWQKLWMCAQFPVDELERLLSLSLSSAFGSIYKRISLKCFAFASFDSSFNYCQKWEVKIPGFSTETSTEFWALLFLSSQTFYVLSALAF